MGLWGGQQVGLKQQERRGERTVPPRMQARWLNGVDGTNSSNRALVGVGGSCSRGDLWANTGSLSKVGDVTGAG